MTDYGIRSIVPTGWLRRQLELQAEGLSGNLDKIWPSIRDSGWIGGDCDSWERLPYWLDGFIPLAFLLDDADLKGRAVFYVHAILERQQEDGWICPCPPDKRSSYDTWAHMLVSKILVLYYSFTGEEAVKTAVYRATKCYYRLLQTEALHLFDWAEYRWFEEFITLRFLYKEYKEDWIPALGRLLQAQGADYTRFTEAWKTPHTEWNHHTHIVNLAMMLKYEALTAELFGEPYTGKPEALFAVLEAYNGTAVGILNGDECVAGSSNIRGAELCSVVELMYSCETLYALTGNPFWAERLEKVAFNALPATISDDMWTHQYDQQVNQIGCIRMEKSIFPSNSGESNLFGLEPNFGCCTANFSQGWPKLAIHGYLRTEEGISCPLLLPAAMETEINGARVQIACETEYPFAFEAVYRVTVDRPTEFELKIRLPQWARNIRLNGQPADTLLVLRKQWSGTEVLSIRFEDTPHLVERPNGLQYLQYGPLVFSLPIAGREERFEYERDGVVRRFPYCDYALYPVGEWRYGFAGREFTVTRHAVTGSPFASASPGLTIKAKMARVDWDTLEGQTYVAAELPNSPKPLAPPVELELCPYGAAKLRMTELPAVTE